jgi:hypothetical protein
MKLDPSKTQATVDIRGNFTASELESLISRLAVLRSDMSPPVPEHRMDAMRDPDKPILMEHESAMTAALRTDGSFRLWLRNRGLGWLAYEVDVQRARALANYILARSEPEGVNLFGKGGGTSH